jgi:hypothetical protein
MRRSQSFRFLPNLMAARYVATEPDNVSRPKRTIGVRAVAGSGVPAFTIELDGRERVCGLVKADDGAALVPGVDYELERGGYAVKVNTSVAFTGHVDPATPDLVIGAVMPFDNDERPLMVAV